MPVASGQIYPLKRRLLAGPVLCFFPMVLHHSGVEYSFDYDFAPNDGTDNPLVTEIDGQKLNGEIFIRDILVKGNPRPVNPEVLALMEQAAARQALEEGRVSRRRLLARAAEYRRTKIAVVPRRA
jgi:hypothetical protein